MPTCGQKSFVDRGASGYDGSCALEVGHAPTAECRGGGGGLAGVVASMISCDFKPSDVNLTWNFPPLIGTFGKTECECAAFYIVYGLALGGDTWRAITWHEISMCIRGDLAACASSLEFPKPTELQKFVQDLSTNPFARPDFFKLAEKGYARWLGEPGGTTPIELTAEGLERLRKWAKTPEAM